jgi:hypothetical protein
MALRAVKTEDPVLFPSMEGVLRTANARCAGVVRAACHAETIVCLIYCWNSYK